MQYRNRILIGYFIGIVLIIVSDKYNFWGFNVPKVLRDDLHICYSFTDWNYIGCYSN